MQEVDRLGWAATTAFRVGPWAIGVRSNTLELDAVLRAALPAHVLEGVEPPRNYSIAVHPPDQPGAVRPLNVLWRQYSILLQSRFPERAVRSLLGYLGDHAPPDDACVRVPAVAVVGPGGAVVADPLLSHQRSRLSRLLRRFDLQVVDSRWAMIDDDGGLVVPTARLEIDDQILTSLRLAGGRAPTGPDLPVPPGIYPIRSWLVRAPYSAPEPSNAKAVSWIVSRATDLMSAGGQRTLDALARSVESATVRGFQAANLDAAEAGFAEIAG